MLNFSKFNIETNGRTSGKIKTFCPQCREKRKNKQDKSLSVNLDSGLFYCHYCEWKGCVIAPPQPSQREREEVNDPGETPLPTEIIQWFEQQRAIPPGVLAAMRITGAYEFMPQTKQKEWTMCFRYFENGRHVNTKFRDLNKHFKMTAGAELIPYNIDAIRDSTECDIVEGEIDVLSCIAAGRRHVISVPSGANRNLSWLDRFVETHFENKQVIYIATDNDRKGRELRDELVRRLGAERCRIVAFSEGCKDANEQLVKHGPESLAQAFQDAPEMPLEGVFTASDVSTQLRTLFENGLSGGADTGWSNLDHLCTFELGRLCVVTGIPGCGKSEFIDELVVRLCLRHDWKAAYFSPENMPLPYHLQKLAEKLTGRKFKVGSMPEMFYTRAQEWMDRNISSVLPKDDYTVANILSKARELVRRKGIRILIVDPFNRMEHQIPEGQSETQYISAFLDSLTNFALRNNCLVILVAHPRKMRRDPGQLKEPVPTLYDINGSAAFFNKCDFGLVVERDRKAGVTRIHVEKVKFRHLGNLGSASFVFNIVNGRFSPCEEVEDGTKVTNTQFDNGNWLKEDEVQQLRLEEG